MKDPLYECGRPYDTILSLFFTALWLQRSQSLLVQEIQPAKDIDLACCKTLPTKAITCLPMGPLFLSGRLLHLQNVNNLALLLPYENSYDDHPENSLLALPHSHWRRDALQPPRYGMILQVEIHVATSPMEVFDV